jgi:hypothetical protein
MSRCVGGRLVELRMAMVGWRFVGWADGDGRRMCSGGYGI